MAKDETEAKDTKAANTQKSTYDSATNPSGASDEQLKKGEMTGKVRGPDVDSSFHTYEFTDPTTGEPVETTQVVHDVASGVNKDGSVTTEKGNASFVQASGGEAGEKGEKK